MQKQPAINPVFSFLEKVFNIMLANVLFLLCSLPVITIGASLCGMIQVIQDQFYQKDAPTLSRFIYGFKRNFLQGTLAFLMLAVFLAGMGCNALLVLTYCRGWVAQILYILLGFLTAAGICILSYLFPLIVRYENPMKVHLNNALILSVVKLPRTIAMALLNTLIFWIAFFSLPVFISTLVFWMIIGFGFITYSDMRLLAPVFRQMEEEDTVEFMN